MGERTTQQSKEIHMLLRGALGIDLTGPSGLQRDMEDSPSGPLS